MKNKLSISALFTAFAVVLSYIETLIPMPQIPGAKLGLANFAIVLALYLLGNKEAIIINFVRILIVGAMFGNLFSIFYSIAGAVFSFLIMAVLKKWGGVSFVTVAIAGGVFHNIGQLVVAGFVVETYGLVSYIPLLLITGIITGAVIGILADIVYQRTKNIFYKFFK